MNKTIKVKGNTLPKMLAGSIMHTLDAKDIPVLSAIGANAVNTAIKACAVAVLVFKEQNRGISIVPSFVTETTGGKEMTVINLTVLEAQ